MYYLLIDPVDMNRILLSFLALFFVSSVQAQVLAAGNDAELLHTLNQSLTEAVVFDGFSPPVASRIYAYCSITAYESLRVGDTSKPSLVNQLKGFEKLNDKKFKTGIDHRVVMIESFRLVAKDLVYRFFFVDSVSQRLLKEMSAVVNPKVYAESIKAGEELHSLIEKRIKNDNYAKTRDMPKFTPSDKPGHWKPTSPTFGDALEPYWYMIKPFNLDSLTQFKVANPPPFSKEKGSVFYNMAKEVYDTVMQMTPERREIAFFWDCNPQKTNIKGHLMYKTRQLTPPGHWMGITRYACQQKHQNLFSTAKIYALVCVAMADGFINIWSEKFRTDNIRPETYIQENIDPDFRPLLETPLFPEHPSAHSVISSAAGAILDNFFGDDVSFVDSTEITFGLKPRSFHSFSQAGKEAAMSRMYGGIHYKFACEEGNKLGAEIGAFVLERIKL